MFHVLTPLAASWGRVVSAPRFAAAQLRGWIAEAVARKGCSRSTCRSTPTSTSRPRMSRWCAARRRPLLEFTVRLLRLADHDTNRFFHRGGRPPEQDPGAVPRIGGPRAGEPCWCSRAPRPARAYERLCRSYVHLSSNTPAFEKICFRRYFLLAARLEARPECREFVLLDSDVLLFRGVGAHVRRLVGEADFSGSFIEPTRWLGPVPDIAARELLERRGLRGLRRLRARHLHQPRGACDAA